MMNKRIKELAVEAVQLVANEHTKGDVSRLNTDSYQVKDLINVKFAELIIKECLGKVAEAAHARRDPFFAYSQILEHFGVEE
jgi:hypothetical protein